MFDLFLILIDVRYYSTIHNFVGYCLGNVALGIVFNYIIFEKNFKTAKIHIPRQPRIGIHTYKL